jgi:hypothetical protein
MGPGRKAEMGEVNDIIVTELKAIWDKYEPQRSAERTAAETRLEAQKELAALNQKRLAAGLPMVTEYRDQSLTGQSVGQVWMGPPPKTWRDEMEGELLSCLRRYLA